MTATSLGFIGLGQMGRHMARNLMGEDVELTVCARSDASLAPFVAESVAVTRKPLDLAHCLIIFLCVPGDAEVREVLLGAEGLAKGLQQGQLVVDCSTISHKVTLEVAEALGKQGVGFLDAPVSGMEARAKAGTLTIMVGGAEAHLTVARPYLQRMGNNILHMGPQGSGQLTKLMNQLLFNINIAALAEILPLAVKMGLDAEQVGEVINSGTGRSYASDFFIPRILADDFSQGYPLSHAYKDLISASMVSATNHVPLPVLSAATATYQAALCQGLGHEDKGAMIKVFEKLLQVRYRK